MNEYPLVSADGLKSKGWTVLQPKVSESLLASLTQLGQVIQTTEITPRANAKAALATDKEMQLHTDHPRARWINWECIRQSSEGGYSLLKDTKPALDYLTASERDELRVLSIRTHVVFPDDTGAYGQHVCIIVLPDHTGRKRVGANAAADAFHLVCRHHDALPGAANDHPQLAITRCHPLGCRFAVDGVISALRCGRADIDHIVPKGSYMGRNILTELNVGVIAGNHDALGLGHRMFTRC